jgi:hypothetical protein
VCRDENSLGVLCSKDLASLGGTGLQQQGGSLGARRADVRARDCEELAVVIDLTNAVRVGINTCLFVEFNSIISP